MDKNYTLKYISKYANIICLGNSETVIKGVSEIENIKNETLVFVFDNKYISEIEKYNNCNFLIKKGLENSLNLLCNNNNFLISENPKYDMSKILSLFELDYQKFSHYQNVYFGENVIIGRNVSIAPFSFIGKNSVIGDNVEIMPHCFIGDESYIGNNTKIYPNVSIMSNSHIGKNVIIQSNSVIGSDGYGYVQTNGNNHFKIPQVGNVILENDVEIGSNVSIDRATIGSTIIKKGTKIDNMVHIAHNVKIGERSLIIAQSGIAGSSVIGDDVIIAGQAGISGHINIGNKSIVMGKSGVTKSFPENSKISGFPARDNKDDFREKVMIKKIPKLIKDIEELKNNI